MTILNLTKGSLIFYAQTPESFAAAYGVFTVTTPYKESDLKNFVLGTSNISPLIGFNGSEVIIVDENDEYATDVINLCLSSYTGESNSEAIVKSYNSKNGLDLNTLAEVRSNFYITKTIFNDTASLRTFGARAALRIKLWRDYYTNGNFFDFKVDELIAQEKILISEGPSSPSTIVLDSDGGSQSGMENLVQIYTRVFGLKTDPADRNFLGDIYGRAFQDRQTTSFRTGAFFRAFQKVNPALLNEVEQGGLSKANLSSLFSRMEDIGLLRLAGYAAEISTFGAKRAANVASVKKSASEFVNEAADVPWLTLLGEVFSALRRDAILFANLVYYMPSLVTFVLDTVALVGDYSNDGKGGGKEDPVNDPDALIDSLEKAFGSKDGKKVFTLAFKMDNTAKRIQDVLNKSPYRPNISPAAPDVFHLRLGASNFYVPPITIDVSSAFKAGSLMGSALRQKNSPKFNSGYRETTVRMRLFFPNYEEIWGISIDDASQINLNEEYKIDFKAGGDSEEKIDKFLSSLRGLVAAFKYSPFLPIRNHYLNSVHGITAVGLSGMTVSTIPNFPFALAVDLELVNFNHKPFLPMLSDFNQAIHWGKYRQYMGKAAGILNRYVNESFLLKTTDLKEIDTQPTSNAVNPTQVVWDGYEYRPVNAFPNGNPINVDSVSLDSELVWDGYEYRPSYALGDGGNYTPADQMPGFVQGDNFTKAPPVDELLFRQNVLQEWEDGNHIVFYVPAESQTKLFLPSTSSFRTEQEKIFNDLSESTWESLLRTVGVDVDQSAGYGIPLADVLDISRENAYTKSVKQIILDSIDILTAGSTSTTEQDKIYSYLITSFLKQNTLTSEEQSWMKDRNSDTTQYPATRTLTFQGKFLNSVSLNSVKRAFKDICVNPSKLLDFLKDQRIAEITNRTGIAPDGEKVRQEFARSFSVAMYERFFQSGPIQSLMEASRARAGAYQFNEWEVPMVRVEFDKSAVIINGVTVSMGNNIVKLQIQMQDEPTYQHIGGKDSYINVSMTVIGEKELIKMKKIFDHLSGLARLEHASGVIGFLGIKNIITALAGIKYVMPLSYEVNTRPNMPHVYDVQLTLVDFDIYQQKREQLSSQQQRELVEHFGKRNPFLRIKQLWGAFNAYPDFPLEVKNSGGEVVGTLDPDFYFRSFEMFDKDVINNFTSQEGPTSDYSFDFSLGDEVPGRDGPSLVAMITNKILEFLRLYNATGISKTEKDLIIKNMATYIAENNITRNRFLTTFYQILNTTTSGYTKEQKNALLTDFIEFKSDIDENDPNVLQEVTSASFQVGSLSPGNSAMLSQITAALEGGAYNETYAEVDAIEGTSVLKVRPEISFHPDDVSFHYQIFHIPATDFGAKDEKNKNRIPAMLQTALGTHYGYTDRTNGRFYLVVGGENVKIDTEDGSYKLASNRVRDTQTPDQGTTRSLTGVAGVTPLSGYQNPQNSSNPHSHWETMMVDTKYRDISGRMIRAFPTYMLWLIDEGGYFAGVKLFDNFYGLQSIIDFSVVSSEDLLGDTLIFRVSNLYSKLTKKESTQLFSSTSEDFVADGLTLSEGLAGIVDRSLNMSRNIVSGLRNEYIVDINNIQLKPGVRVHLRAGYGANPNSLQTIFNGVITNVEQGEIVTITAQSDAIELGAVVNSTNKKGDSGKIDGGVDTGMYLSEPRDLMVRLLSMGSSRTREAFAHATRGTIFSENKFGIRHFGNILYEPLSQEESTKNDNVRDSVQNAFLRIGGVSPEKVSASYGFSSNTRYSVASMVGQLWANFSAQVDLEIFKRNIYAGNGLGIAQFMGGDLDDGWSTAASMVEDETYNDRVEGYLGRLTDLSYNRLLDKYQQNDVSAKETIDEMVAENRLIGSDSSSGRGIALSGTLTGIVATLNPVAGVALAGTGLLGILSGRGGTNIFRTLGIISPNEDDDLSGFDEVSFRAQTYMRTVWDLFQTCARLLPNYIVAVRPFEDRSTVFYGKPHWLYTSGVVPVTTGIPVGKKAEELGISGPAAAQPDQLYTKILDTINRDTSPLSDYSAFFQAYEPNETFKTVAEAIATSSGIYAPTSYFSGKILNFYSNSARVAFGPNGSKPVAQLPISKGLVAVGPHLPIIAPVSQGDQKGEKNTNVFNEHGTEGVLVNQKNLHKQINNLPPRYSFPYFAINETAKLSNSSTIKMVQSWELFSNVDYTKYTYNGLDQIIKREVDLFSETKFSLMPSVGTDTGGTINLDTPLDFTVFNDTITGEFGISAKKILMPLPQIGLSAVSGGSSGNLSYIDDSYSFEYQPGNYGKITYKEWGAPETPEDEQFYIAMRWPYNPEIGSGADSNVLAEFKETYGIKDELVGSAKDYKERKVLVYNPDNGRAVVCRPAYFMWGEDNKNADVQGRDNVQAVVSPDAAFFLSIITFNDKEAKALTDNGHENDTLAGNFHFSNENHVVSENGSDDGIMKAELEKLYLEADAGYRTAPLPQECMFAFVPDDIPVGVLSTSAAPIAKFALVTTEGETKTSTGEGDYLVGFGKFTSQSGELQAVELSSSRGAATSDNSLIKYRPFDGTSSVIIADTLTFGGNPLEVKDGKSYFQLTIDKDFDSLSSEKLKDIAKSQKESGQRTTLIPVWDPSDLLSIQARSYYDENYDSNVSVIAGNGRQLKQAQQIWDLFRAEYHNYDSVKRIFFDVYGLDPDNEDPFPEFFKNLISGSDLNNPLQDLYYRNSGGSAQDEFAVLFGADYAGANPSQPNSQKDYLEAIEYMRVHLIDATFDNGGLVSFFNNIVSKRLSRIYDSFFVNDTVDNLLQFSIEVDSGNKDKPTSEEVRKKLRESISTPKQLYLLIVGIFRQRMWEDAYSRAWVVLKPDVKPGWTGDNGWSLKPIDKIFRAFIDPSSDLAKPSKKAKFLQLLMATRGEGNSSRTYFSEAIEDIGEFASRTIGPIVTAVSSALSGLLSMFRTSMQQLGYALSEVGNFKKQAHVLNKALNDSIYYSLGRPGTILRAVDNPFTREYGEPVIEIREPFQRIHYITSFSHILSNQIQENLNGVSTVVTAVSDGKYPVSVALDKGAPAERQVEKTVETGILFDNVTGSGLTGFIHPFMHPLETFRGIAKNVQGAPDELSARRIALAHLKESIKDIYGGELIVLGNTDVRPHDLVYLADVYERMYGIFEVEQVVHHFTPELGFITSITPNALVTVNDPARWFMTSWMQSWMHVQSIRNDTRIYMDNIRSANSGMSFGGNVSVDKLGDILKTQIVGGFQFTHGSSALVKDVMANQAAMDGPSKFNSLANQDGAGFPGFGLVVGSLLTGGLLWKGWEWVRDNVLDQHGCYVQYLNKNGQPMDAGLSYNQGMVVGQHHSTSLLPGILGVKVKTRTAEGNSYIRTDDLLKNLGWSENEVNDLVRHISYESALVHARVLELSGMGPEKAGFEWQFRVLCKVTNVLDGDTIDVQDILSGATFRIRLDGINASETNVIEGKVDYPDSQSNSNLSLLDVSSPGGQGKIFVKNAIEGKIVVARINQTRTSGQVAGKAVLEQDFEAGSALNTLENYQLDIFGSGNREDGEVGQGTRAMGNLFYYFTDDSKNKTTTYVSNLFRSNNKDPLLAKAAAKNEIYDKSPFYVKFDTIFDACKATVGTTYFNITNPSDTLFSLSTDAKQTYSTLVYLKLLEEMYEKASQWPRINWDEYYDDGHPVTLNWELVVNNLAKVFVKDLQKESQSVQTAGESAAIPNPTSYTN